MWKKYAQLVILGSSLQKRRIFSNLKRVNINSTLEKLFATPRESEDSVKLKYFSHVDYWSIISKSQFCISSIWQMNFSLAMNAIWREKSTARNKAGPHTERCMIATSHTVLVGNTEMRTYSAVEKKKMCRLCYKQEIWCAVQKINWYPSK